MMRFTLLFLAIIFSSNPVWAEMKCGEDEIAYLRNANGKIVGKVVPVKDFYQARSATGRTLGRYVPRLDKTYSKHGKLVGHGNWLSALIFASIATDQ